MLRKSAELDADEVVIDFEDSVAAADKTTATRQRVAETILATTWRAPTVAVRINAVGTPWFEDDLAQLIAPVAGAIACVVLPKVESAEDVVSTARLLDRRLGIEVMIESALGVVEVERIASSSDRLEALIFGPGDYAASLGIPQLEIGAIDDRYPGDQWHYPRSRIAVAARAYGLEAIDGPYAAIADHEGLRESALRARLLGFAGKWAIHPSQLELCNAAFTPTAAELARAREVIDALKAAEGAGQGAVSLGGEMLDDASRRMAEALLVRAGEGVAE